MRQVHHQTAKRIIRYHSYLESINPITVKEMYDNLKNGQSVLLKTGAKLICEKGRFYVSGYAMDQSDINTVLN